MSGRVIHFEIPYQDAERARGFYRDVFDWTITEMPEMNYNIVSTGPFDEQGMPTEPGFIGGGMMERQGEFTGPTITIAVDSIDGTLKQVNDSGGSTVMERSPVADMGFVGYFKDPEGNLVGLWENAPGAPG